MQKTAFIQPYSKTLRIWHWLTFLAVTFLLITVLSAEFFLDKEELVPQLQNKLQSDAKTASALAGTFTNNIWDWHTYVGYGLAALFVFRIVLEFFQPKEQKFFFGWKKMRSSDLPKKNQFILTKYIYTAFYLLLAVIVFTGIYLALNRGVNENDTYGELKELHEISYNCLLVFLFLHLGGVILAELTHSKGIVSNMINGGTSEAE